MLSHEGSKCNKKGGDPPVKDSRGLKSPNSLNKLTVITQCVKWLKKQTWVFILLKLES